MHHPTDMITHTTAFVTPVVEHWLEREIAQWVSLDNLCKQNYMYYRTGPDVSLAKSSANGLVCTGFACRYRLHPTSGFLRCKVTTPSLFCITNL